MRTTYQAVKLVENGDGHLIFVAFVHSAKRGQQTARSFEFVDGDKAFTLCLRSAKT